MALGLLGRKVGMTRVFTDDGESIPVTVIAAGVRRPIRVNEPQKGHFRKAGVVAGTRLREFRASADEISALQPGAPLNVEMFSVGQIVDVTGTSQGKGFAGTIKRHNFRSQGASHGNSVSHRAPGSIGMNQSPGRVFRGKRMAGHMGAARRTAQGLKIVRVDAPRGLLLIQGSVPGSRGGDVIVRPTTKGRG